MAEVFGTAPGARKTGFGLQHACTFALAALCALSGLHTRVHAQAKLPALRGVTIGPIESSQHPDRGYGSAHSLALLDELQQHGVNAIALTPFGRVWSLDSLRIEPDFEWRFEQSQRGVRTLTAQAKARGMRVLIVPHLWVETGGWRGDIEFGSEERWHKYQRAYRTFVLRWAEVAEQDRADVLSIGVECKSWSGRFGPFWTQLIRDVRKRFHGQLTYSANWDEADDVLFWDQLDLIGINAFYPLSDQPEASYLQYAAGASRALEQAGALGALLGKPVLFTEFGYTSRPQAAVKPWLWPDDMQATAVDEGEQARALSALLGAAASQPWLAGAFLWRYYADLDDVSQEASWGFSPHAKLAELVLFNIFGTRWASDPSDLEARSAPVLPHVNSAP
jgi:hypothetical protein